MGGWVLRQLFPLSTYGFRTLAHIPLQDAKGLWYDKADWAWRCDQADAMAQRAQKRAYDVSMESGNNFKLTNGQWARPPDEVTDIVGQALVQWRQLGIVTQQTPLPPA